LSGTRKIADVADHEGTSALRCEREHLSSDTGAKLLRALGINGPEAELRSASDEFGGHCLALALLGSYLTDAFNGDIRFRKEVSERLAHDVRKGVHARKVSGVNKRMHGRNATGGSFTIIERSHPSSQIISGTWSHFS
jgi:hypothetical protein